MICALCGNKTNDYLTFVGNKVVCINCAKKYGMAKDDQFSSSAKRYANCHTINDLKLMLENYGEFSTKQIKLDSQSVNATEQVQPKNLTRRLIAGILLIVAAAMLIIQSLGIFSAYSIAGASGGILSGFWGLLTAAAMIVQGIYYIKTKCSYKNKNLEWAWFWVYAALAFLILNGQTYHYFHDLMQFWPSVILTLWVLGYRWGEDQIDLINQQKQAATQIPQQMQSVQESTKKDTFTEKADQIEKYKKLLDENAISQEEYDEIKSKILKQ